MHCAAALELLGAFPASAGQGCGRVTFSEERGGVATITRANLSQALPAIRRVLETLLPPADVDVRMKLIRRLIADGDYDIGGVGGDGGGDGGGAPPTAHASVEIPSSLPLGHRLH